VVGGTAGRVIHFDQVEDEQRLQPKTPRGTGPLGNEAEIVVGIRDKKGVPPPRRVWLLNWVGSAAGAGAKLDGGDSSYHSRLFLRWLKNCADKIAPAYSPENKHI
jgi:hypothetical protein